MATIFCESFDMYASVSDMLTTTGGPWTSASSGNLSSTLTQFTAGQSYTPSTTAVATFTSATNETTIYGSMRLKPQSTGSSSNYGYISFADGGTAQCTIRFNTDGSVNLYGGGPTGTLLQSYSSIYTASAWNSFQFKVVIDNAAGSIELRVNGSGTNAITKTSVNTRVGTSNAYANGLTIGNSGANVNFDDLYLNNTSGNNPVSWPGDMRAIQMVPVTAVSSNFTAVSASNTTVVILSGGVNTQARTANSVFYTAFTPSVTANVVSITFTTTASATANVKCSIYDGSTGVPGTVLGTSNVLVNPVSGTNTVTFSTPAVVIAGVVHFLAFDQDASVSYQAFGLATGCYSGTTTYASFPVSNPGSLTGPLTGSTVNSPNCSIIYNTGAIAQLTEDADITYISSTTVQQDTYSLSPIPTQHGVVAMQYYVMWRKTDAGARTVVLSTNVGSGDTAEITNSSLATAYLYQFKLIEKDPTGSYWTPTTANAQVFGLAVTA